MFGINSDVACAHLVKCIHIACMSRSGEREVARSGFVAGVGSGKGDNSGNNTATHTYSEHVLGVINATGRGVAREKAPFAWTRPIVNASGRLSRSTAERGEGFQESRPATGAFDFLCNTFACCTQCISSLFPSCCKSNNDAISSPVLYTQLSTTEVTVADENTLLAGEHEATSCNKQETQKRVWANFV